MAAKPSTADSLECAVQFASLATELIKVDSLKLTGPEIRAVFGSSFACG